MPEETSPAPTDPFLSVPADPRVLTDSEFSDYSQRLLAVGCSFTVAGIDSPVGFDVISNELTYSYRYDGSATTAVELMERICSERGA